jgi:hypothetical protein
MFSKLYVKRMIKNMYFIHINILHDKK